MGTTFTFTLNTTALVKLTFTHSASGRKVKGRCAAPSRRNRKAKACKRTLTYGPLTLAGHAGSDKVAFDRRVGSRKLKAGRYTVAIVASNSAGSSGSRSISFTIVKR